MKNIFIIALLTLVSVSSNSQVTTNSGTSGVKWYSIQEAEQLIKQSPRPIFIDTYTDWCGW